MIPKDVSEVILGQVLSAGAGQNLARQAAMGAGIPVERTAYGINQLCGFGLRTIALGSQAIKVGDSNIVVAGSQESMSQSPHVMHLRDGTKMGRGDTVIDTDQHPKVSFTAEGLGKLRAAFIKEGTVTAGNSSGINGGAAVVILMSAE